MAEVAEPVSVLCQVIDHYLNKHVASHADTTLDKVKTNELQRMTENTFDKLIPDSISCAGLENLIEEAVKYDDLCDLYASLHKAYDVAEISVKARLEDIYRSAAQCKIALIGDKGCVELARRLSQLKVGLVDYSTAVRGLPEKEEERPLWFKAGNFTKKESLASAFVIEIERAIVTAWETKGKHILNEITAVIPEKWEAWTVDVPDESQIKTKLLESGLISEFSKQNDAIREFLQEIADHDVSTGHKFSSGHATLHQKLKTKRDNCALLITCTWFAKK